MKFLEYFKSVRTSLGFAFSIVPKESAMIIVIMIISSAIPYMSLYLMGKLVNDLIAVVTQHDPISTAISTLLLYAGVSAIPSLTSAFHTLVSKKWEFKFQTYMEIYVLRKRMSLDIAQYEDPAFQDLIQRAFRQNFWPLLRMADSVLDTVLTVVGLCIGSVIAVHLSLKIYLIIVLSTLPRLITEIKYGRTSWSIWEKDSPEQRRFADIRSYFLGRKPITETKLLQSGEWLLGWAEKILLSFNAKNLENERSKFYRMTLSQLISVIGFTYAMYLILLEVSAGTMAVGGLLFMLGVLNNLRGSITSILVSFAKQYEQHLTVKDLVEFFETKPVMVDPPHPMSLGLTSPPFIQFENVGFKYPHSGSWSLRNINLTLTPGSKIGLVGNNGAGKTTLVKLLCRIYDPTEGRILVNGVDLRQVKMDEWLSYVGYMSQSFFRYDFLVKEAIAIGRMNGGIDLAKVRKSAEISQASDFIESLENKYDHSIGVEFGGIEPSHGQNQKLAIAKTLYRNAFLTIFDEPTASVDAESEAKIFDSLSNLSGNITAILISHDFSTIAECDKIVVLHEGQIEESGNHPTLMAQRGRYAELYRLQADRFRQN